MKFNRQLPGSIRFSRDEAALLEFEGEEATTEAKGLLASMGAMFDSFAAKFAPKEPEKKEPTGDPAPAPAATFSFADVRPLFEDVAKTFAASIDTLRKEFREEADRIALQVKGLEEKRENTPAPNFTRRAPAGGGGSADNTRGVF